MTKDELIKYWVEASDLDFKAMNNLFASKDFVWSLFLGHLVIEKLLKAIALNTGVENVPKIHNLNKLAKTAGLEVNEELADLFDSVTAFNIETRYPDYKKEFYNKADFEFTNFYIDKIKNLRLWLIDQLKK
jgi:HEPN domain-containing protein